MAEPTIPSWTSARAAIARAVKDRDSERAGRARADLAAAKLRDHITRVVDGAPKLTQAQIDELTAVLRGAATVRGAA